MFHQKVKDRHKLRQLDVLREAENELYLITREVEESAEPIPLDQIFANHKHNAMLAARFYHECVMLDIPCVLKPATAIGTVDAIIELSDKFVIVEFLDYRAGCSEIIQKKYRSFKIDSPVIFFHEMSAIRNFLVKLCTKSLSNSIFSYTDGRLKIVRFDGGVIHINRVAENKQDAI